MINGTKNGGKIDILLVNDNSAETISIQSVLKKARIINRVHVLAEGADILEFLFRRGRFANESALPMETLILLPLRLNGLSGIDVLRKIKGDERSRNYSVILLAATQEDRGVMEVTNSARTRAWCNLSIWQNSSKLFRNCGWDGC